MTTTTQGGSWGMGGQFIHPPTPTKKKTPTSGGADFPGSGTGTGAPFHSGPAGTPMTGITNPTTGQNGSADSDAFAQLQQILNGYGLASLAQWAWGELTAGKTEAQVVLDLYNTPEFQQRFPGIGLRQQAGLPPISPGDYINYENTAIQLMKAAGLPASFWSDRTTITNLIAGDTSLSELQSRVGLAAQAVYQSPQAVRDTLQRDYGISAGMLAGHFLDPKATLPELQQQFLAAQIGGAGTLAGYTTDRGLDERLAGDGVTFQAAQAGFNDLGLKRQLFAPLAGEDAQTIGQDQQISAEFEGNADAQKLINRRAQQRAARFQGSGGFSTNQQGYAGLSTAQ